MNEFSRFLIVCLLPVLFFGAEAATLGDISNNLMGPVTGLARVMHAVCYVAGVGFFIGGLLQYKYHRENPQQVRLSTPIVLVLLGVVFLMIPLVSYLSDASDFIR